MNLATFRDAIADHFTDTYPELNVNTHGGPFTWEEVKRYAERDPALIIAITGASTEGTLMTGTMIRARISAVVMAHSRAGEPKDSRVLRIATYVLKEIAKPGQYWGLSSDNLQAPQHISGDNLFTSAADKGGIALFGIAWDQLVDCTETETWDDLSQIHAEYDLGPEPDDTIEATDDILLNGRELHVVTSADITAGYFTLTGSPAAAADVVVRKAGEAALLNKRATPTPEHPNFDVLHTNQIHINNSGEADGLTEVIILGDTLAIDF